MWYVLWLVVTPTLMVVTFHYGCKWGAAWAIAELDKEMSQCGMLVKQEVDSEPPSQTRGKTRLSDALKAIEELKKYDEAELSRLGRRALERLNVPAGMLVDGGENYASVRAERRAWDEHHYPSGSP